MCCDLTNCYRCSNAGSTALPAGEPPTDVNVSHVSTNEDPGVGNAHAHVGTVGQNQSCTQQGVFLTAWESQDPKHAAKE